MKLPRRFSLIELLVVLAILLILISMISPALKRAVNAARLAVCQQNLHQIGLATQLYCEDYQLFPPGIYMYETDVSYVLAGYVSGRDEWYGLSSEGKRNFSSRSKVWECPANVINDDGDFVVRSYPAHSFLMPHMRWQPPDGSAPGRTQFVCNRLRRPSEVVIFGDGNQNQRHTLTYGVSSQNATIVSEASAIFYPWPWYPWTECPFWNADKGDPAKAEDPAPLFADEDVDLAPSVPRYRHLADTAAFIFGDLHATAVAKGALLEKNVRVNY